MAERPILFSGPMVRAILAGRKTQTRRVVKDPSALDCYNEVGSWDGPGDWGEYSLSRCPYGVPGDVLWVREQFSYREVDSNPSELGVWYWADGHVPFGNWTRPKPSIHMPRWASRLSLLVKSVRVERLQDISQDDAQAEGLVGPMVDRKLDAIVNQIGLAPSDAFRALWDTLNAKRAPWVSNPWVWVVEFEVAK